MAESILGWLQKGHGRAALFIERNGLGEVFEDFIEACIRNEQYDSQAEDSRAEWLFGVFRAAPEAPVIRTAILHALQTEEDVDSLQQLCELAACLAKCGDSEAGAALKARVLQYVAQPHCNDGVGASALLSLEGNEGLLALARVYGRRLLADAEEWPNDTLLSEMNDRVQAVSLLLSKAEEDEDIKAYVSYLQARDRLHEQNPDRTPADQEERSAARFRKKSPLERILLDDSVNSSWVPDHFGELATPEEITAVWQALGAADSDDVRARLLRVFSSRPIPHLDDILFTWATGSHARLRQAALFALACVQHEQVHEFARRKLVDREFFVANPEVLTLFRKNLLPKNVALILKASRWLVRQKEEELHRTGFFLESIAREWDFPELEPALLWVYEHSPCGICRLGVVRSLARIGRLTGEILEECLRDACADIRSIAQACRHKAQVPAESRDGSGPNSS